MPAMEMPQKEMVVTRQLLPTLKEEGE